MTDATADKSAKTDETTPTLVDQLDDPRAGNHGTPVHARCISCEQVRVKRAPVDPDDLELKETDYSFTMQADYTGNSGSSDE
jgi:hypothetical protein